MTAAIDDKSLITTVNQRNLTAHHSPHCRRCGNANINRIPRGRFVKVFLFFLPLKKYVCYNCHRKTYRWGKRH